jgi:hypothetical protein
MSAPPHLPRSLEHSAHASPQPAGIRPFVLSIILRIEPHSITFTPPPPSIFVASSLPSICVISVICDPVRVDSIITRKRMLPHKSRLKSSLRWRWADLCSLRYHWHNSRITPCLALAHLSKAVGFQAGSFDFSESGRYRPQPNLDSMLHFPPIIRILHRGPP